MKIKNKFIITLSLCYLFLLGTGLVWVWLSLWQSREQITSSPPTEIKNLEFARLQTIVDSEAKRINSFFDDFYHAVLLAKDDFYFSEKNPNHLFLNSQNVYPEENNLGLPGYGYINNKLGVYADFDKKGLSCPWAPRATLTKALQDSKFKNQIKHELETSIQLNQIFTSLYNQHPTDVNLVWLVYTDGITNVFPAYDYNQILKDDPTIADLDESQEDYVRLLNSENNPNRNTLWLDPYFDEFRKTWMTSVVTPIYLNDRFVGTMGIDVLLNTLSSDIVNINLANNSMAFLLDSAGRPLATPQKAIELLIADEQTKSVLNSLYLPTAQQNWDETKLKILSTPLKDSVKEPWKNVVEEMTKQKKKTQLIETDAGNMVVSISPIQNNNWSLAVIVPEQDVFLPVATSKVS